MFKAKRSAARGRDAHALNAADRELLEGMSKLLRQNRESNALPNELRRRAASATESEHS